MTTQLNSRLAVLCLVLWAMLVGVIPGSAEADSVIVDAHFDTDSEGFSYADDLFRGTSQPAYASGTYSSSAGASGGGLSVTLGNVDSNTITGMSGGWQGSFTVPADQELELGLSYNLTQAGTYESDEVSQLIIEVDGQPLSGAGADYIVQIAGDGNTGPDLSTGWVQLVRNLGVLGAGTHTLTIGAYNGKKTLNDEFTDLLIDDVRIATPAPPDPGPQAVVDALDLSSFKQNIEFLSSPDPPINGSRHWTQPGNQVAVDWIKAELESYGYTNVVLHPYTYSGQTRYNVYATKIGSTHPEEMYIVGAHLDSKTTDGTGDAAAAGADDDASGTSLVLEAARVFANPAIETDYSIRFTLWNNEETGLIGSKAYVADRQALRGIESPAGSGEYPEPAWRGMIQHDMILYDHGIPPQADQLPQADLDIEYKASETFGGAAIALADAALTANIRYATDYPAEVSDEMSNTDSAAFQSYTAAISLRENRRLAELGSGSNPYYHKATDLYGNYSDADYLFGFNFVQTTVGTVADLAGARLISDCGNDTLDSGEQCDDGNTTGGDCCSATCQFEAEGSSCEDGDLCSTNDTCNASGACSAGPPLSCNDGLFCNGPETCSSTVGCEAGAPPPMDDGVSCTVDSCDEVGDTVVNAPADSLCDNGLYCDGAEFCHATLDCQDGTAPVLTDSVGCTADSCDEVNDTVVHTPEDTACDNGQYCDGAEFCHATLDCQDGTAPVVADAVGCTVDSCDEDSDAIVHAPDHASCDNGQFCDGAEICDVGLDCQVGTPLAITDAVGCTVDSCDEDNDIIVHAPDDASCDDALYCNGAETCDIGLDCQAGTPPVLTDAVGCTADTCDEVNDTVVHTPEDSACDNGQYCDGAEFCHATLDCQDGTAPVVADAVGCTVDSCDEANDIIVHAPDHASCDDVLYCNGAEICDVQLDCQVGTPPAITDAVGCTVDSCDEANDIIVHAPDDASCDDALYCNGVETCDAQLDCQAGAPPVLTDAVGCTADTCDEANDTVVHTPEDSACDNGLYCDGAEFCHATLDCQDGAAPVLTDVVGCTADTCDEANDTVVHTPEDSACDNGQYCDGAEFCHATLDCQDGTAPVVADAVGCTVDSCDEANDIIVHAPDHASCDDALYCNGAEICDVQLDCQVGTPPAITDAVGCTVDSCDEANDIIVHAPDDASCDDALYCNGVETCDAQLDCQAGAPPVLTDAVGCTADTCDEANDTVVHTPEDSACDNGLYCDGAEFCHATLDCQDGAAPVLTDVVGCTADTCDEANDTVVHTPEDSACDNGQYCDGAEFCHATLDCQDGTAPVVADAVGCTVDSCDEDNDAIVHAPDHASCDNGQFCDGAEICDVGLDCQVGTPLAITDAVGCTVDSCDEDNDIIVHAPDDASCDDALYCNGAETCDIGLDCQAGTPPVLTDAVGCTADTCDEVNDTIVHTPEDTACDNGQYCDGAEFCHATLDCQDGTAPVVADAVGCTVDSCDEANDIIVHAPDHASCDDALYCNGAEICDVQLDCQVGTPPAITDAVGCTVDSCDEANDIIVHAPDDASCDDALYCNGAETCDVQLDCQVGTPPAITDAVGCTVDSCDEDNDVIVHAADDASCDDALYCNGAETCDAQLDCQAGTPPVLADAVSCTADTCDEANDTVIHTPEDTACDNGLYCDGAEFCHATLDCQAGTAPVVADAVGCTVDSCDEENDAIVHAPDHASCDNGQFCDGAESCDVQSDCQTGTPPVLTDAVGCTADACDEVNDTVVHTPEDAACDNGLYCDGAEFCHATLDCQDGAAPVLTDAVGCTADSCDEATDTVVHTPEDAACDNGLYCDGLETCDVQSDCQAGTPPVLADAVSCTADTCDEANDTVVHTPEDAACDNGQFCDGAEFCHATLDCQDGTAPVVADAVGCTVDSCDEDNDAIVHAPDHASCDNGQFCDGAEICDAGLDCQDGTAPVMDDAVSCTADACDEVNDVIVHAPDDTVCNDGLYCNGAETCDVQRDCEAGAPPLLDDGVSCTVDSCDEASDNVAHAANDGLCDNGQFCDGPESCDLQNDCQPGTGPAVDDGVSCTVDSCDEAGDSIVHAATDSLCDNGAFCDGPEVCDAVLDCGAGTAPGLDDGVACTVDSCDEVADSVVHAASDVLCDNGVFCDGAESCDAAFDCQAGTDPCAGTLCDEPADQCVECFEDAHCDNGLYCDGLEACAANVCVAGTAVVCDDGVVCTGDSCDEAADSCESVPSDVLCDNGVFCDGAEICDLALGCLGGSVPCEGATCDESQDICELVIEPRARLEAGTLAVGSGHLTVPLVNAYASPVVVCSIQYLQNTTPVVARVSNVTPTSFDVRLQSPSGAPVAAENVDYIVVEEGVWTIDGREVEAWTYQSTVTDTSSSWLGESQSYGQSYLQPVVLGQVMTENDPDWSVFWSRGSSRTVPPSPTDLATGKTVCEDDSTVRADETIGVIVFEAGHGTMAGTRFEAALGTDTIRGVGSAPPYLYSFAAAFASTPDVSVVTMAAMDGGNGGWTQTHGPTPATPTHLYLSIDEDQVRDSERSHTTEQVAFVVFEEAFAFEEAPECAVPADCDDGLFCNGAESCAGGICQPGVPVACDDAVGCTVDACNETSGGCEHSANDSLCDDGLFCDGLETCHLLLGCQAGAPVSCDDGVDCTVDSCNETADSCGASPDDGYCDNSLFCDGSESCDLAVGCQSGGDPCPGLWCSEGNDVCVECFVDAECPDVGNLCTDELCVAGFCESLPNALLCDDGIACTYGDQCAAGACQGTGLDHGLCDNDLFCDGVETCDVALGCQAGGAPCTNPAACDEVDDICLDLEVIAVEADFDADAGGFGYLDDAFRGTSQPAYASGAWLDTSGYIGGALSVTLGGIDNAGIAGMSGGWRQTFSLGLDTELELRLRYNLTQTSEYESNELSQVMVTLDGVPLGSDGYDYVAEIKGDGNGGPPRSTGWMVFRTDLGFVSAGMHTITIGGYNSKKTYNNESTTVLLDELRVGTPEPNAVAQLRLEAEGFDERSSSAIDGAEWLIAPDEVDAADDVYSGAEGICSADGIPRYVLSLPDQGVNHSTDPFGNGPVVSYAFEIVEAGAYRIWIRAGALDGTSDSFYLRIRETDGAEWWRWNPLGTGADLMDRWQGSGAFGTCTAADPAVSCAGFGPMVEVLAPGTYHLEIAMREDGSALDAIILDGTGGFDGTDLAAQAVPCAAP